MIPRPATPLRLSQALVFICLVLMGTTGCVYGPRSQRSDYIPPPLDVEALGTPTDWDALMALEPQFTSENYLLGPGDEISIAVLDRPELFSPGQDPETPGNRFTITENPMLVLPHVGAIRVHDKTPRQLERELAAALSSIVRNPTPIVTIERFESNQVTVLGTVATPGRYPLQRDDTLLEMIFKAGGLTLGARNGLPPAQYLKVYRSKAVEEILKGTRPRIDDPMELTFREDGPAERREIIIPLDEFILGGDLSYNIPLLPDDVVYIPPAGTVSVHGSVENPRVVFLGPGLRTVDQVLTEVGGLRYRAHSRIEVVRPRPSGVVDSYYMDGRRIMARRERDFALRDNDRIYVYTSGWRAVVDDISNIFRATASTGVNATYTPAGF